MLVTISVSVSKVPKNHVSMSVHLWFDVDRNQPKVIFTLNELNTHQEHVVNISRLTVLLLY